MTAVGFDAQIFRSQSRGGISRYFVELLREFDADPALGVSVSTPFRAVRNEHLLDLAPRRFRPRTRLDAARERLRRSSRPIAGVDLVHHTYYDPAYLDTGGRPSVSTVHDMIPELMPEAFTDGNPHRAKHEFVRASDGVICVSETTRRDLMRVYDDVTAAVVVIPHGVGPEFWQPTSGPVDLPSRYVLFVGKRSGYKDWSVLVAAWAEAGLPDDVELLCIGGGAFTDEERATLAQHGLGSRASQRTVSDAELPGVYAAAELLVFPSRYEGFGIPVLEAFAAGCPVVLADTDCFREVADDAGLFFAPGEPSALAAGIGSVVRDAAVRARFVESGTLRAKEFTWRRSAELTADFYRQVLA